MKKPSVIELKTIVDSRGSLAVIDKVIDFDIKRVFYIYGIVGETRGGHAHKKTRMLLTCVQGSVKISVYNLSEVIEFVLNPSSKAVLLEPYHWHTMDFLESNSILLVCASEHYDYNDYIYEKAPWK